MIGLPKENVLNEDVLDQEKNIGAKDLKKNIRNFAILTVSKLKIKTLVDNDDIMIYEDGYYIKGEKTLQDIFDEEFKSYATASNFKEFLHYIRSNSHRKREDFIPPENFVNLNNCVIDVTTGKVCDHNSDYNFIYKLYTDFNKDVKCPETEKFLRSIVSDKDYSCLIEMIGYTFMSGMKFRNFFVLVGTGANGKSKLMELIEYLLGRNNCSHVSMQSLSDNRFASASLYGKKANICADISNVSISDTGVLKQLTGEDMLMAEQKGKNAFFFKNEAKIIFSCNDLPDIKDKSDAMWERIVLLEFPNEFKGDKQDKELMLKITTKDELSGLLNIALDGIKRLITYKNITYDFNTTMDRWYGFKNSRNPLISFIRDCIVLDDDKCISKKDAYVLYNSYCESYSIIPLSNKMFNVYIRKYLNQEEDYYPINEGGKQEFVWKGIRISDNWISEFREK